MGTLNKGGKAIKIPGESDSQLRMAQVGQARSRRERSCIKARAYRKPWRIKVSPRQGPRGSRRWQAVYCEVGAMKDGAG